MKIMARKSLEESPVKKSDIAVNRSDIAVNKSVIAVNKPDIALRSTRSKSAMGGGY